MLTSETNLCRDTYFSLSMRSKKKNKQKKTERRFYERNYEIKSPCWLLTFQHLPLSQTTTTGWSTPTMTTTPSTTPADRWMTTARVWTATPLYSRATWPAWGPRIRPSSSRRSQTSACWTNTGVLTTAVRPKQSSYHYERAYWSRHRWFGEIPSQWFTPVITTAAFGLVLVWNNLSFHTDFVFFFFPLLLAGFCASKWSVYTWRRRSTPPRWAGTLLLPMNFSLPSSSLLRSICLPKLKNGAPRINK